MSSDAPPSRAETTTSFTCADSVEVKTFTNSGMTAPARVPHEMMDASFHQSVVSPPRLGIITYDATYVSAMETRDVIQTSDVSGDSKFISVALAYRARAMAAFRKYAPALATSIMMRITKIQTSNCTWMDGS